MKRSEIFGGIAALAGVFGFIFQLISGRVAEDETKEAVDEAITASFEKNKQKWREEKES